MASVFGRSRARCRSRRPRLTGPGCLGRGQEPRKKEVIPDGATDVEQLDVPALLLLTTVGCIVAIDVAKTKFVAAIATAAGEVLRLVKFEHPRQTAAFMALLRALQQAERKPLVLTP
jgi:hypothetical protein